MTESHGNENIGQVLQEKTIEPAKEKEKARLEQDCNEYLQNSNRTSVSDFLNFTSNMTLLIGGERHKTKSGTEITSSNSLPNKDTQASIVFEIRKTGKLLSVAEIRVESADKSERLSAYLSAINYPSPYIVNASSLKTTPKFDSYITGGKEAFSLRMEGRNLEANEAKGFARKVFDVYQKQGQEAQPPTPQN